MPCSPRDTGGNRGVVGPGGPRKGPPGGEPGRMARQGADMAGFLGRWGGAPCHGRGGQHLAPPGLSNRPHPLALPPEEPAAAAAPAPTHAVAQVMAAPGCNGPGRGSERTSGAGHPPSRPGPSDPQRPPPCPRRSHGGRTRAAPGRGEGRSHKHAEARGAGTPQTRRPLATNRWTGPPPPAPAPSPPPSRQCYAARRQQRKERGARG